MSSVSAQSPTSQRGFHSPCEFSGSVRYRSRPDLSSYLYRFSSCVNCHEVYSYQSKDAASDWNYVWSVISDHWGSCPKRNLIQTSAIRGTLHEPEEHQARQHEGRSWPPFPPPQQSTSSVNMSSSYRNRSRMEVNSPLIHELRPASPQSPFVPPQDSTSASQSLVTGSFPHAGRTSPILIPHIPSSTSTAPQTIERPLDISQCPPVTRGTSRRLSPPVTQLPVVYEPVVTLLPSTTVLPPAFDRKRKRIQSRETSVAPAAPSPSLESVPRGHSPGSVQPHTPSRSPVHHQHLTLQYTAPESGFVSSAERLLDESTDKDERPKKKQKKNVMDWRVRRDILRDDPLLLEVEAKQVKCKICDKWIKLDARNDYYPGLWVKHKSVIHGSTAQEDDSDKPETQRRRRFQPRGGRSGKKSTTPSMNRCESRAPQLHQQSTIDIAATQTIRSSSRLTRSTSRTSA